MKHHLLVVLCPPPPNPGLPTWSSPPQSWGTLLLPASCRQAARSETATRSSMPPRLMHSNSILTGPGSQLRCASALGCRHRPCGSEPFALVEVQLLLPGLLVLRPLDYCHPRHGPVACREAAFPPPVQEHVLVLARLLVLHLLLVLPVQLALEGQIEATVLEPMGYRQTGVVSRSERRAPAYA